MRSKRIVGIAVGATAAGLAGGAAALRVAMRHRRQRPDAAEGDIFTIPVDVTHRDVATTDGGRIHVIERGAGRTFVLLHGVTMSALSWHYQLVDLVDAGYRVVVPEVRGHGGSAAGTDGYTIARLAEDTYEVLRALDIRDAIVVGHSLGGMMMLQLLADHPELVSDGTVSAIVLASTSASPVIGNGVPAVFARVARLITPVAGRGHAFASSHRAEDATATAIDLGSLYCRLAFGASPSFAHVELVRALTSAVPPEVVSPLIVTLVGMDVRRLVDKITAPTLVVVGHRDLMTPVWHSKYLAANIPGAELVVLPGAGHMIQFERRAELADLLTDWATRWPARDQPGATGQVAEGGVAAGGLPAPVA